MAIEKENQNVDKYPPPPTRRDALDNLPAPQDLLALPDTQVLFTATLIGIISAVATGNYEYAFALSPVAIWLGKILKNTTSPIE